MSVLGHRCEQELAPQRLTTEPAQRRVTFCDIVTVGLASPTTTTLRFTALKPPQHEDASNPATDPGIGRLSVGKPENRSHEFSEQETPSARAGFGCRSALTHIDTQNASSPTAGPPTTIQLWDGSDEGSSSDCSWPSPSPLPTPISRRRSSVDAEPSTVEAPLTASSNMPQQQTPIVIDLCTSLPEEAANQVASTPSNDDAPPASSQMPDIHDMQALINHFTLPADEPVRLLTTSRITSGLDYSQLLGRGKIHADLLQSIVCEVKPVSQLALEESQRGTLASAQRVHIYTDGSANEEGAAWAFVVISEKQLQDKKYITYHGHSAGQVITDALHPAFVGACRDTNIGAELSAAIHASIFALDACPHAEVCIWPDLQGVIDVAEGRSNYTSHPVASELLTVLSSILRTRSVSFRHVKGHSGHPWNELADSLASAAVASPPEWKANYIPLHVLITSATERKFHELGRQLQHSQLPTYVDGCLSTFSPSTKPNRTTCFQPQGCTKPGELQQFKFGFVTMNVLTFSHKDDQKKAETPAAGIAEPGRPTMIAKQLLGANADLGALIIAVQEARAHSGSFKLKVERDEGEHEFIVFSTASTKMRSHGCQLWFSLTDPIFPDSNLKFRAEHFQVLHEDPTRLFVHVAAHGFSFIAASLHAPHSSRPRHVITEWWTQTTSIAKGLPPGLPLFAGVDSNASAGDVNSTSIGDHQSETECYSGAEFHKFLAAIKLFLPSTFADLHSGPATTFLSAKKTETRNDFVALPLSYRGNTWTSRVDMITDITTVKEDHRPAVAGLAGSIETADHVEFANPKYDRKLIRDPAITEAFWKAVHKLPPVPHYIDVDSRYAIMLYQFHALMVTFFNSTRRRIYNHWMSTSTWHLVLKKRDILYDYRSAHCAWKRAQQSTADTDLHFQQELQIIQDIHRLKELLAQAHQRVVRACRCDKEIKMQSILAEAAKIAHDKARRQHLHSAIKIFTARVKSKKRSGSVARPLPILLDAKGVPVKSWVAGQERWLEHFADEESAGIFTYEQFITEVLPEQVLFYTGELDPDCIASPAQLESVFRRLKNSTGLNEENVPSELLKSDPRSAATYFYPLHLQASTTAIEPIRFKSGVLVNLFKGLGTVALCGNSRSVMLSGHIGKSYHRCIRAPLVSTLVPHAQDGVFGGLIGGGTDLAGHVYRSLDFLAKRKGLSIGALFVDIKSAFYSLIRSLVVPDDLDDCFIVSLLQRLQLPPSVLDPLKELAAEPALAKYGASSHLTAVTTDLLRATHFRVKGVENVAWSATGTRPGDPDADVLFAFAFNGVLTRIRSRLLQARVCNITEDTGIALPRVPAGTDVFSAPCHTDVTFFDDTRSTFVDGDASALLNRVRTAAAIIDSTCIEAGLLPRYATNKSALLVRFAGTNSKKVRQQVFNQWQNSIPFSTEHRSDLRLPTVQSYSDLGVLASSSGNNGPELSQRRSHCLAAVRPLRGPIFSNTAFSTATRLELLDSYATSRLIYNGHILSGWTESDLSYVNRSAVLAYKSVIARPAKDAAHHAISNSRVYATTGRGEFTATLAYRRLTYLTRLFNQATGALFNILQQTADFEGSWTKLVEADLKFFAVYSPLIADLSEKSWANLKAFCVDQPSAWKAACKTALRVYSGHFSSLQQVAHRKHGIRKVLCDYVVRYNPESAGSFLCHQCGEAFPSLAGLTCHARYKHNDREVTSTGTHARTIDTSLSCRVGVRIASSRCKLCLQEFFNRGRLVRHITGDSPTCQAWYLGTAEPWPVSVIEPLQQEERDRVRLCKAKKEFPYKADPPVLQAYGPFLQAYWPRLKCKRAHRRTAARHTGESTAPQLELDFAKHDEAAITLGHGLHLIEMCVLLLFSGHRRENDIQTHIQHQVVGKRYAIFVLAIDVCIHAEKGDLLSHKALLFWESKVLERRVVAGGAGPPCETWTASRYRPGGPGPLRSQSHLFGLPRLTRSQRAQVDTGNQLLLAALHFFALLLKTGGAFFLEHPQFPDWTPEPAPSIWLEETIGELRKAPCVMLYSFDQGCLGQASVKPTSMLLLRLPQVARDIQRHGVNGRCGRSFQAQPSIGKDASGAWHTAKLKVYPPKLNEILASGIVSYCNSIAATRDEHACEELPQHLSHDLTPFFAADVTAAVSTIQPDYHPALRD